MWPFKRKPPADTSASGPLLRCSFCNKSQRDVRKLIAGPNVYICNECVSICNTIVEEGRKDTPPEVVFPRVCRLCGAHIPAEEGLVVPNRGLICFGCRVELQALLGDDR